MENFNLCKQVEIAKQRTCGNKVWCAKQICVFEHSFMTNFNCACQAIQRGQGSGFLSEGSSWLTACMSEQRRLRWLAWTFATRIGDKYQIRLTQPKWFIVIQIPVDVSASSPFEDSSAAFVFCSLSSSWFIGKPMNKLPNTMFRVYFSCINPIHTLHILLDWRWCKIIKNCMTAEIHSS